MSFFNGGFGGNGSTAGFGAGAGNAPTRFGVVGAGAAQPPSFATSQSRPGAGWGSNGGFRTATAVAAPQPPGFGSFLPPTPTASANNKPFPTGNAQPQRTQAGATTQPATNFAWGSRVPVAQPPRPVAGAWPAPTAAPPTPPPRTPAFQPAPGFPPAGGWLQGAGVQQPRANPANNNVHNLFVLTQQQPQAQPQQQTAPAPAPAWPLPAQPAAPPPAWPPAPAPAPQPVNNPFVWPSPPTTPQQQQQPAPPTPQTTPWTLPPVRTAPPSPVTPPPQPPQQQPAPPQPQQQATPQMTAASWPYGAPQLVAVGTPPATAVPIVNPASFALPVPTVVAAPAVPATPPRPTAVHSERGARAVQAVRLPPRTPVARRVATAVPAAATAVEAFEPRANPRSLFIRDDPPSPERRAALAAAPSAFAAAVQAPPQATAIAAEVLQPAERAAVALSQAVSLTTLVQAQPPSAPLPTLSNPAYYCKPSLAELGAAEAAAPGSLQAVQGFELGCHHVGAVRFLAPVDLTGGADLSALVVFRGRAVGVYPQEDPSAAVPLPPPGRGLNVPAEVTLLRIFPRKPGADEARLFRQRLQQAPGTHFVSYDEQEGTWRFQVTHF